MDQGLLVFKKVVEWRNFSKAANELHMSQPAVSQYIRNLERDLDVRLLERTNKYVEVNKAGEIVYEYATTILKHYEKMTVLLSDLKNEPKGNIKIGASYTIGEYVLPAVLAKMQAEFPQIIPEVTIGNTEEIGNQLLNHQIDIGVIEGEYTHTQINVEPFLMDYMYVIASASATVSKEDNVENEQLENETWIIREEGSGTRRTIEDFLATNSIVPKRLLSFGSTQTIKEGVEAGLGLTLLSERTIAKELELGLVCKLPVEATPIKRHFSIIMNQHEFHPKASQVFQELMRQIN